MPRMISLERGVRAPISSCPAITVSLIGARALSGVKPERLDRILTWLRRGARPAPAAAATLARGQVVGASMRCAGPRCLERSLAVVLLCRLRGLWPDWCCGVATHPFRAHAWVEVDGTAIGEDEVEITQLVPILRVPAA